MKLFYNRRDAGKQLGLLLKKYENQDTIVYALPRGGVTLAAEIAQILHAPLDLLFAHKIGHPHQPEYAIAAVSESGHMLGSPHELRTVDESWLEREKQHQIEEIQRKRKLYLKGEKGRSAEGKIAIIVDDGIATGLTMMAAIKELKDKHPSKIIVAVPVSPKSTADIIGETVDEFVGIEIPEDYDFLGAVGAYYDEFNQVEDDEVIALMEKFKAVKK